MIATENTNAVSVKSGGSWQSPKNVENERIFGQIVFDALRQLIREEIDAALKRAGSTFSDKEGYASGMSSAAAMTSPGKPTLA